MRTARIDRDAQRYLVGHGSPDIHGQYGRGPGLKRPAADVATIEPLSDDLDPATWLMQGRVDIYEAADSWA